MSYKLRGFLSTWQTSCIIMRCHLMLNDSTRKLKQPASLKRYKDFCSRLILWVISYLVSWHGSLHLSRTSYCMRSSWFQLDFKQWGDAYHDPWHHSCLSRKASSQYIPNSFHASLLTRGIVSPISLYHCICKFISLQRRTRAKGAGTETPAVGMLPPRQAGTIMRVPKGNELLYSANGKRDKASS